MKMYISTLIFFIVATFQSGHTSTMPNFQTSTNSCFSQASQFMSTHSANTLCHNLDTIQTQLSCWHQARNIIDKNAETNAAILCQKTKRPEIPVTCFRKMKDFLTLDDSIKLCSGLSDLAKTFGCMKDKIGSGMNYHKATTLCHKEKFLGNL